MDQGGIEPLPDPDRPYCSYLVGHELGRREICPKKYHFFGKIKIRFSQKSSKISTSEQEAQEAQEAQTELVFAQTKFVFANFPNNVANFWGNWPRETARARARYKARS